MIFLFGSSARKKAGIPIVNILIRETCDGSSGYVNINTTDIRLNKNEKIFFTRNKLAERWILLTTLLPSSTTSGIHEKSDSRSTSCDACAAASLPEAIAILQSASFKARTSFRLPSSPQSFRPLSVPERTAVSDSGLLFQRLYSQVLLSLHH